MKRCLASIITSMALSGCASAGPLDQPEVQAGLEAARTQPASDRRDIISFLTNHDLHRWQYDTNNQTRDNIRADITGEMQIHATAYDVNPDGTPFFANTNSVIHWFASKEHEICTLNPFDGLLTQCLFLHVDGDSLVSSYGGDLLKLVPQPRNSLEMPPPLEVPVPVDWKHAGQEMQIESKLSGFFDFSSRQMLPNTGFPIKIPGVGHCLLGIGNHANGGHDILTYCDDEIKDGRLASVNGILIGTIQFAEIKGQIRIDIQDAIDRFTAAAAPMNAIWSPPPK